MYGMCVIMYTYAVDIMYAHNIQMVMATIIERKLRSTKEL